MVSSSPFFNLDPSALPSGSKATPGLTLVATPIGNAADISLRAWGVLSTANVIACEDTRVTGSLMARYGISTPLISYHEHNAEKMRPQLLQRLKAGEAIALVSDAGTPLISDPGYKLVQACVEEDIPVTAVPGASAPLTALIISGLPTDRFLFAGFLPPKTTARQAALQELLSVPASLVFFESPQRLSGSLADMTSVLGPRPAAVARELTKLFEEVRRGSLPELATYYQEHGAPKGEIVIVVGPPSAETKLVTEQDVDKALSQALKTMSVKDAVTAVSVATGWPKRQVYARALQLNDEK